MAKQILLGIAILLWIGGTTINSMGLGMTLGMGLKRECCARHNSGCWPSLAELEELRNALNPEWGRDLWWEGGELPLVSGVGIGTMPRNQPLYAMGRNMTSLYVQSDADYEGGDCFVDGYDVDYCKFAMRNNPVKIANESQPAFVAFPLTAEHVATLLEFARYHNLCVCVASTGHDFMVRHSCGNGLLIRMPLFKDVQFNRVGENTVTLGAGLTFHEAHYNAALNNRVISSGWATTVGVVGWNIGGGHGPHCGKFGLGVDNIVELEMVLADSSIVTVNNNNANNDLFFAMRGGGGSTFGIVTSITLRTHPIPAGGFTRAYVQWDGSMCDSYFRGLINHYVTWMLTLNSDWSGLTFITPFAASEDEECATFSMFSLYVYQGGQDSIFNSIWSSYADTSNSNGSLPPPTTNTVFSGDNFWEIVKDQDLEVLIPVPWLVPRDDWLGGVGSVLVPRDKIVDGEFANHLEEILLECMDGSTCNRQELYQDITGQIGSPQDFTTSTSTELHTSILHYVAALTPTNVDRYYEFSDSSYFSESAISMSGWRERYWGDNYDRLVAIKEKYDPTHLFWCLHCIGDESD